MASNSGSKVVYFLAGVGVGTVIALLFAPRSGEETREFLRDRAEKGRDYIKEHSSDLREKAHDLGEKGKEFVGQSRESLESALEAGKRAYKEERQKT